MSKKIEEWDKVCIEFFEKICHWIQIWAGINNFAIAKILIIVDVLADIILHDHRVLTALAMLTVSVVIRMFIVIYGESYTKVEGGIGFVNPLRFITFPFYMRIFMLCSVCLDVVPNLEHS